MEMMEMMETKPDDDEAGALYHRAARTRSQNVKIGRERAMYSLPSRLFG